MTTPLLSTTSKGILAGVLAGALWGLVFLFPRLTPEFSPMTQMVIRYFFYGCFAICLGLKSLPQSLSKLTREHMRLLLVFSLTSNIFYYFLLANSVLFSGMIPVTLIIGALPVTIAIMGKNDTHSLSPAQLVWPILFLVFSLGCISTDQYLAAKSNTSQDISHTIIGFVSAFGALVCWTLYAVWNARFLKSQTQISGHDWSALVGICTGGLAIIVGVCAAVAGHVWPSNPLTISLNPDLPWLKLILLGAVIAILASWAGNSLWNYASHHLPISLMGQLICAESFFSLLYGFIFDLRWPRTLEAFAILFSFTGVVLAIRSHQKSPDETINQ